MRFRLVTVAILLAVASGGHGRPRDPDPVDTQEASRLADNHGAVSDDRSIRPMEKKRELKDIQNMDQSLRTVATQLLNASSDHEQLIRIPDEDIVTIETPMQVVHISTRVQDTESANNYGEDNEASKMKFGIPMNSKFGHFEMSNPGHAMAITEEELEREMAAATQATQKPKPTTDSMLSTWIQLYPAVTTEGTREQQMKNDGQKKQVFTAITTRIPSSTVRQGSTNVKPIRKNETKPTQTPVTSTKNVKPSASTGTTFVKISTSSKPTTFVENSIDESETTEQKSQASTASLTTSKASEPTKKPATKVGTTVKAKNTTPKNVTNNKSPKPVSGTRVKPFSTRRPGNKTEGVTSTSKIEKVTFKPIAAILNRTESTERPQFITKIKAGFLTDSQKPTPTTTTTTTTTTTAPTAAKPIYSILTKSNFTNSESINRTPHPTKVNNLVKVNTRRPIHEETKIEIEPIRVNPPVLTIEKIGEPDTNEKQEVLENSKVDIKFDFNPDVEVKISTTETAEVLLVEPTTSTTTKKPRGTNKRKRNKNRRRKPTTTTTTTEATTDDSTASDDDDSLDPTEVIEELITGIQESKIEPESKAPPSKKKKPNQQAVDKPIGTQIYNFLSREVMPSVGVMSLVGLGLGLASYFLYPFGGVIARRNYEVEPNYKYNMDEYGGNYGLSEEEVLSKVYSGMTPNGQKHDAQYNSNNYNEKNPNYYRYTGVDPQPTKFAPAVTKPNANRAVYRPVEPTSTYEVNYRNTEFKYPDVPTTPNYYQRQQQQQQTDFVSTVGKSGLGNNRQFVVGNVPKEYSSSEVDKTLEVLPIQDRMDHDIQYQSDESYTIENSPVSPLPAADLKNMDNPAPLVDKVVEDQQPVYEDVEINPVNIEHGPRSLRSLIRHKRGIIPDIAKSFIPIGIPKFSTSRIERNSVIQVIPSKSEIEKERKEEEQEEPLSNEILDIIDDAIVPGKEHHKKKFEEKDHKAEATANKPHNKKSDQSSKTSTHSTTSTTLKSAGSTSTATSSTAAAPSEKQASPSTTTTTTTTTSATAAAAPTEAMPTEPDFVDQGETTLDWQENVSTTAKPINVPTSGFDILGIAKRIAEVKLRLGLTILKHASEGFARYIGHIQKRFNGEEQ